MKVTSLRGLLTANPCPGTQAIINFVYVLTPCDWSYIPSCYKYMEDSLYFQGRGWSSCISFGGGPTLCISYKFDLIITLVTLIMEYGEGEGFPACNR